MTDDELLGAISAAEEDAIGGPRGEIAADRADAIDRYLGKAYGDEAAGRSQVISRDVADVVEGVLANVLKPFVAGETVVEFQPRSAEDSEAAEQESDYVNFVVLERNNGFLVLNAAVKDALLLRAGYIKCGWHVRDDVTLETYQGMTQEEAGIILQDPEVEVVSQESYPDPIAAQMQAQQAMQAMQAGQPMQQPPEPPMLYNLKMRRKVSTEYVRIDPVPPDEILVSARLTSPCLQEADFVQHRARVTLSDLRQMGYDVDDDISDDDRGETVEGFARERFAEIDSQDDDQTSDPARRIVLYRETYMRVDYDGDGVAELRRVCAVGANLLANEEADVIPYASFAAVVMPHQHLGISVYDMIQDLARIKTALLRQYLDNLYLANNGRTAVNVNNVNIDDLLTSRPGGVVRVDGDPGAGIMPLVTPDVGGSALTGLEYMDSIRENRTGYTKAAEGLKSGSLATDTATEYMQQINQSQMRLEMIARTIAETGVRDLFRVVHALTLKHSTKAEKVKLRNHWVEVNPREWARRTDLSISVGLGTSSQQQQMQNLMLLAQMQEKLLMSGLGIVQPEHVFNLAKKLATAAGFKNAQEFFGEPQPQPPQKPPEVQAKEVEGQFRLQEAQIEQQGKGAELQAQAAIDRERMQNELTLQASNDQRQLELEKYKIDRQMELEKYKADLQAQSEMEKARFTAGVQLEAEQVRGEYQDRREGVKAQSAREDAENRAEGPNARAMLAAINDAVARLEAVTNSPRRLVRGPDGRAVGVEVGGVVRQIERGKDGRVSGMH